jgi:uncharacterized delta-60 repeat protein/LPXTG-motif cell wall-anchored protein
MASATTDGALDTTFGTGGKVTTTIGGGDLGKAVAIQSDGKIIVVGDNMTDVEVVRYNTDGSLDTTFGTSGKVTTDIGTSSTDTANAVAIQSDGKIVIAGSSGSLALNSGNFAVMRYNADGSLDTTFDTDGKVTTDIGTNTSDTANAVAIQSDGKIVVAGTSGSSGDFAVVRYTTSGALDTTFDTDGKVTTDIGTNTNDTANAVAIQSDGKIVVAGTSGSPGDFAVVRYTTSGALDTTFDTDGKVTTDVGTNTNDTAKTVAIQSDGKIVVAGTSSNNFAVVRFTAVGALDTTFDTDGKVTTDVGTNTNDTANAVAIQSDGKIVVAGESASDFAVVRYTTSGALDTTFDTDGKVTTDIGTSTFDTGTAAAIQGDSKIVVAGRSSAAGPPIFAVARYEVTATSPSSSSSSSSSSTTVAASSTTVAASSTTVAAPTTTVASTTNTAAAGSTTTTNAVAKRTTTPVANMVSTTLPKTGSNSSLPAKIGALVLLIGLVLATRRRLVH